MVLLVDTNIILDVLLSRPEFVKDSSMIWKLCETEQAKGYLSTLTYVNMMYVTGFPLWKARRLTSVRWILPYQVPWKTP